MTAKLDALVAVPPAVVTEIFPVVAPLGTVALICVAVSELIRAARPLNFTAEAPARLLPVIVTTVLPATPLAGEHPDTDGAGRGVGHWPRSDPLVHRAEVGAGEAVAQRQAASRERGAVAVTAQADHRKPRLRGRGAT